MTELEITEMQARLASLEEGKKAAEDKAAGLEADKKVLTNQVESRLASLEEAKKAAEDRAAELEADKKVLTNQVKSLTAEVTKNDLPSFPVENDPENDVEGGMYQFTSPTFTWDDNRVINVRELVTQAEEEDKSGTTNAKALPILAALVHRKSGLIKRMED